MASTAVSEGHKTNGHRTDSHAVAERPNGGKGHTGDEALLVSQEIMRLVEASKEGQLSERGKPTQFNGM